MSILASYPGPFEFERERRRKGLVHTVYTRVVNRQKYEFVAFTGKIAHACTHSVYPLLPSPPSQRAWLTVHDLESIHISHSHAHTHVHACTHTHTLFLADMKSFSYIPSPA